MLSSRPCVDSCFAKLTKSLAASRVIRPSAWITTGQPAPQFPSSSVAALNCMRASAPPAAATGSATIAASAIVLADSLIVMTFSTKQSQAPSNGIMAIHGLKAENETP